MFEEDLLLQGPSEQNGNGRWHDVAQWRIGLIRGIRRRNGAVKRRSTRKRRLQTVTSAKRPQGEAAAVFASGIVSKNDVHSRLAISPDGKDMCWTSLSALGPQGIARLLCVSKVNEQWTPPQGLFSNTTTSKSTESVVCMPG